MPCRLETSGIPLHKLSIAAAFLAVSRAVQASVTNHFTVMSAAAVRSSAQRVMDLAAKRGYDPNFVLFLKDCILALPLGPTLVKLWRAEFFPTCAYTKSDGTVVPWKDSTMVRKAESTPQIVKEGSLQGKLLCGHCSTAVKAQICCELGNRCVHACTGLFRVSVGKHPYVVELSSERGVSCSCATFGTGDICRHIFACARTVLSEQVVQTKQGPAVPSSIHRKITNAFVGSLRLTKWFLNRQALPITREAVPLPATVTTAAALGAGVDRRVRKRQATRRK